MLEATMICLDNSEWSRNGDFIPTRLTAQCDAANLICGAKSSQNPESVVGLLTLAGDRVVVRVAPTTDLGKMLEGLHEIPIGGTADIVRAIQTAQLALKHRVNRNQRQRIVLFVGSPIAASERQLTQIGRTLKKNNISLDLISFGEVDENRSKLEKLYQAVDTNNGMCNMLECVPENTRILTDAIMSSRVVRDLETMGDGPYEGELAVDPTADPELYMALQLSLQEEQNRQQQQQQATTAATTQQQPRQQPAQAPAQDSLGGNPDAAPNAAEIAAMEGIDEELRQALLLSLQDMSSGPPIAPEQPSSSESFEVAGAGDVGIRPSEDAAHPLPCGEPSPSLGGGGGAAALSSSSSASSSSPAPTPSQGVPAVNGDQTSIQQFITNIPGVDMTDPRLLEALQQVIDSVSKHDEDIRRREGNDTEDHSSDHPPPQT